MLLTTMPGGLDYLALISVFAIGFSFIVSLITVFIIALIKKDQWTFRKYFILWLKIFVIMTVAIIGFAAIIFLVI